MLSDEVIDKVIERLIRRIEKVNTYTLKQIAKTIKKMSTLAPSDTQKLIQILNYGGDYEKILKEIAKMTNLNEKEIYEIFQEVAKSDYQFARQFYKYRNKKYIPYEFNKQLKSQVEAIAKVTADTYRNISQTLAFSRKGANGKVVYSDIGKTYQDIIDEGIISLQQGKDTFNQQMAKIVKELSKSGIRTIDWESGISRRLEYATRMHLQAGIRNLHNKMQQQIADEIGADGVEISVHNNPAPDHQDAQGRQFRLEQFNQLQETGIAKDYKGKKIDLHRHLKNGDSAVSHRPISQYNCYHYTFSIILGVNKPQYTDEQLNEINERNLKGFEYGGKHYTMYEGTQLQRKIENAIRKEKDTQIMAKESEQDDLVQKSEKNINTLLNEYLKVSKESGLPTKMERLKVEGYKQTKINDTYGNMKKIFISKEEQQKRIDYRKKYLKHEIEEKNQSLNKIPQSSEKNWDITMKQILNSDIKKYNKELNEIDNIVIEDRTILLKNKDDCKKILNELNINLKEKNLEKIDKDVLISTTKKYYELAKKYPFLDESLQEKRLTLEFDNLTYGHIGEAEHSGMKIGLNISDFSSKEDTIYWGKYQSLDGYNMPCSSKDYINYFQTHEMGHIFNYRVINNVDISSLNDLSAREFYDKTNMYFLDRIFEIASDRTGKPREELEKLYMSNYGKSKTDEAMAELFANANCGKPNELGKAFDDYFKELLK